MVLSILLVDTTDTNYCFFFFFFVFEVLKKNASCIFRRHSLLFIHTADLIFAN